MGVGGEVEGAKRVTLASHVFPQKVSRPVNLQVGLQIWLLLKTVDEKCEVLHLLYERFSGYLHCSDFQELLVFLLVHVEARLYMLDQLHPVHLEFGTCFGKRRKN